MSRDIVEKVKYSENRELALNEVLAKLNDTEHNTEVLSSIRDFGALSFYTSVLEGISEGKFVSPEKAAEVVAKSLRDETIREILSDEGVIKLLVGAFASIDFRNGNKRDLLYKLGQSLVNICYKNESATNMVIGSGGLDHLITLVRYHSTKDPYDEDFSKMLMVCLSNMDGCEACQKHLVEQNIVPVFLTIISRSGGEAGEHAATVLSNLQNDDKVWMDQLQKQRESLISLLDTIRNEEILDDLLTIIQGCFDGTPEEEKIEFYRMGLWDKLSVLVENNLQRGKSTDLMLIMLTNDECMLKMFDNGKGSEYQLVKKWLRDEAEVLKIAGALTIGNFARTDSLCMALLNDSIGKELIALIDKGNSPDILQAVLSALRNLLIPKPCKESLKRLDVLKKLLSLLPIESHSVAFKFIGCLRMLADKQPDIALELGKNSDLMKQVIANSEVQLHAGLQGEAMRVICWILKNNSSDPVKEVMLTSGALKVLVRMLQSEHIIMKNEAIIALSLLINNSLTLNGAELSRFRQAFNSDFTDTISAILKESQKQGKSPEIAVEFVENVITLLLNLCILEKYFKEKLREKLFTVLQDVSNRTTHVRLKDKVCKLLFIMEE